MKIKNKYLYYATATGNEDRIRRYGIATGDEGIVKLGTSYDKASVPLITTESHILPFSN